MNTLTETDPAAVWTAIRGHLEDIKNPISAELRNYPQPIAGCDQQFNHLSERRERIFRELDRLDAVRDAGNAPGDGSRSSDAIEEIEAFIASSPYIDAAAAAKFRARLKEISPN